ncbi:PREDICTED: myb-like protein Q [Ceratosolen solmsi marchali]|uniref:Myb-like protein Q n=1 Tax=Ceratosolen solmsi marchali TaxID=326594 RepID=A0AAJ6YR90_9HYME|nr:PREDICTED: myb-like protein Q [Ceratosolen solmsi marchali]
MSQSRLSDYRFTRYSEIGSTCSDQTKQSSNISNSSAFDYRSYQPLSSITERCHQSQKQIGNSNNNTEYANSSVLVAASTGGNPFGSETFPSPPSPAPVSDRFIPPPPLSPSASEKYASSQSLANYPTIPSPISSKEQRFASAERLLATATSSSTVSIAQSSVVEAKDQQQYSISSTERLLSSASPVLDVLSATERCVYGSSSLKDISGSSSTAHYDSCSTERLLSSSPIHVPVPERFSSAGSKSNEHGSYQDHEILVQHQQQQQQQQQYHHNRFGNIACTTEKFLSSPLNMEAQHQRYSSNERILATSISSTNGNGDHVNRKYSTDRNVETTSQKYADTRTSALQVPTEFSVRFPVYQDNAGSGLATQRYTNIGDRFNNLVAERYSQTRPTDRFSSGSERYLPSNSNANHDVRQTGGDLIRYSSSSLSSPLLLTDAASRGSHHQLHNLSSNNINTQSTGISEQTRYTTLSPTPDSTNSVDQTASCYSQQSSKQSAADKYHHQLSKSTQSYPAAGSECGNYTSVSSTQADRYDIDKFNVSNVIGDARFQAASSNNRYHCTTTERFPTTCNTSDKYLSLPKSKDRYSVGGCITSSCVSILSGSTEQNRASNNSYIPPTAHTPVERYVPQPPVEVLYPDRYIDRYVPSGTSADRYVLATDPGDSYIRRDLGFHNHYRLPLPAGYPYPHHSHFRFRGFAYQSPGHIGGSPSSSSSSSSTSTQRDCFSTSPLMRFKLRTSSGDFKRTANAINTPRHMNKQQLQKPQQQPACCIDASPGQRATCCQSVRRSIPLGPLLSIPQQASHPTW